MLWFFGQSLLFIGLAFLLGLLVGWLIWGRRPSTSAETVTVPTEARTTPEPEPVMAEQSEPEAKPEPAAEPEPEPVPVAETEVEPVAVAEPVAEAEQAAEPVSEPVAVTEPVVEPEPVAVAEPVAEPVTEPVSEPVAVAEPAAAEPVAVPVAPEGPADNLQRLEGVGPKIAAVLYAAEIRTFAQLAATDQATLSATLRNGGLRVGPSVSTWTKQAELLAAGDEAEFTALASQLVASRRGR